MSQLEGKTALVSGAADGLGEAIAARLAAEGARVAVLDRSAEAIERSAARPEMAGVHFEQVDLCDATDIAAALDRLDAAGFAFDILVNNAGGSLHTPRAFVEETDDDWERVMTLNVTAAVRLTRAVVPGMVDRRYGRIINLGSKAGRYGSLFTGANYVAAKGAIQSMTLQLAQEFGPYGITCNAVCPGATLTPRVERLLSERQTPEERARVLESIPVRRHGTVGDVAHAVSFFASGESGFITGQLLDVNGGQGMCS
ncbi:SDR family NAD(P)-dependent oxidoreductase [Tropicimonas sp. IMCC6043]|uniref:SDR family NAD(P)-dependent oxidoreductase n=1 Tax=Tropicimonas sp. IMCC6043 TaxID=2510645 RepID=UPI00101BC6E8|nr:SDR family NAD(P)-dependent oxidoreductase [Tropicimonas sp. IMCC6043]RYH12287.1 SDR family oxidoreductase [Tropicimonas sp. IMCC6043]